MEVDKRSTSEISIIMISKPILILLIATITIQVVLSCPHKEFSRKHICTTEDCKSADKEIRKRGAEIFAKKRGINANTVFTLNNGVGYNRYRDESRDGQGRYKCVFNTDVPKYFCTKKTHRLQPGERLYDCNPRGTGIAEHFEDNGHYDFL